MSQPHTYMHILPCLSRWQVPCTSKTSSFHSSAAGTWSFGTLYTTTSASSSWSRPRNTCSACLSRWHLPRRSPPFIWLVPQPTQKCWQQWPTDVICDTESKAPSSSGMVKANDDGACLWLAHAQVENEIQARPRRAPQRGAREYRRLLPPRP